MKKEKLMSYFFTDKHHGTYDDIEVQIIDYCDANDQERREDFWIFNLTTLEANGLNKKRAQKTQHITLRRFYKINGLKSYCRVIKCCGFL